ncbi:hypothetical protein [[Eubacterium] hominis]|uniref:hypothetical protein n=1 Tax=[Eubacterium] hominis TaxID=2764325 RepID=UPI003A4D5E1D
MKKFFNCLLSLILCLISISNITVISAKDESSRYEEKKQFDLNGFSLSLENNTDKIIINAYERSTEILETSKAFESFLNDNPEIEKEISRNIKNGKQLIAISYNRVYLKEINEYGIIHEEPMTNAEYESMKMSRANPSKFKNLTLSLQIYKDSWNPGYADVQEQAVWSSGSGETGPSNANDDSMALTVPANYTINTHGMTGVATSPAFISRSTNGVGYRFRENTGTQTLYTGCNYKAYTGQRLYVGEYVHTWSSAQISWGFSVGGPSFSVSGTSNYWDLACDITTYSD